MKILAASLPDVETVDFTGLFEEVLTLTALSEFPQS